MTANIECLCIVLINFNLPKIEKHLDCQFKTNNSIYQLYAVAFHFQYVYVGLTCKEDLWILRNCINHEIQSRHRLAIADVQTYIYQHAKAFTYE